MFRKGSLTNKNKRMCHQKPVIMDTFEIQAASMSKSIVELHSLTCNARRKRRTAVTAHQSNKRSNLKQTQDSHESTN